MPILNPNNVAPYEPLSLSLELARVRANDAIQDLGGEVMTNGSAFFQTAVNGAWMVTCEFLANIGYSRVIGDTVIGPLPPVATNDPAIPMWISWSGCSDGVSESDIPALPADMISPLKIWERHSGGNYPFPIHPNMENMVDGLPARPKQGRNRVWEWREDAIYLPGSLVEMDLRVRYAKYLGDFLTVGDPANNNGTWWYNQLVPIVRIRSALAKMICYEVAAARGSDSAASFKTEGENELRMIFNRDARMKQRTNIRRRSRSGRGNNNQGSGCGIGWLS